MDKDLLQTIIVWTIILTVGVLLFMAPKATARNTFGSSNINWDWEY